MNQNTENAKHSGSYGLKWIIVPMPFDKDGNGPAVGEDVVGTQYEVWDENSITVCVCNRLMDADCIVVSHNSLISKEPAIPPIVMPLLKLLAIDDLDATDAIFWRCDGEYAPISFFIRCSDVFHWGCADAEPVTLETLPVLRQAFEDCKKAEPVAGVVLAPDLYCARIRKMRPQFAYFRNIGREIKLLFEAAGPERE